MKLGFTHEAKADLAAITAYIARDNPRRAAWFAREIRQRISQIRATPKAYPLAPPHEAEGIRRCVQGQYLIFYRIDGDRLLVLHVFHGAMDYEPLFFPR
ncbi:plasmid stabilization protein [Azorhizobium oxalatiphilum]|uniref:Plasmid stabilization protein n=1 Tax=Azorhizobium oxalatiphilum TaxID=980631 RepID=A0A917F750_9HYPH|nr:type II toxin-antitoxin system RelE/ParE family toxin [Azorhizobium oxalatiphilum]GGF52722.1 plasmid stabilization protein [Azorhizobium oxalatiphilum]